jgi:hypothetical protein
MNLAKAPRAGPTCGGGAARRRGGALRLPLLRGGGWAAAAAPLWGPAGLHGLAGSAALCTLSATGLRQSGGRRGRRQGGRRARRPPAPCCSWRRWAWTARPVSPAMSRPGPSVWGAGGAMGRGQGAGGGAVAGRQGEGGRGGAECWGQAAQAGSPAAPAAGPAGRGRRKGERAGAQALTFCREPKVEPGGVAARPVLTASGVVAGVRCALPPAVGLMPLAGVLVTASGTLQQGKGTAGVGGRRIGVVRGQWQCSERRRRVHASVCSSLLPAGAVAPQLGPCGVDLVLLAALLLLH